MVNCRPIKCYGSSEEGVWPGGQEESARGGFCRKQPLEPEEPRWKAHLSGGLGAGEEGPGGHVACARRLRPALPSRGIYTAPSWHCFGYRGCNESSTGMGPAHQNLKPSGERDTAPDWGRGGRSKLLRLLREALPGVMESLRGLRSKVGRTDTSVLPIREAARAAAWTVY